MICLHLTWDGGMESTSPLVIKGYKGLFRMRIDDKTQE
jgi:hypothetical protein